MGFVIDHINPAGDIHRYVLNVRTGFNAVQKDPVFRKQLDSLIAPVSNHHNAILADGHSGWFTEHSRAVSTFAKCQPRLAVRSQHLDTIVPRIGHVDQSLQVRSDTTRLRKLSWPGPDMADLLHED